MTRTYARSVRKNDKLKPVRQGNEYFIGLNYLLNNEPDASIDTFIHTLEVNANNLDSQLALGTLLRRRGKVDKSISVYQRLLTQPGLSQKESGLIKIELARSYISAGLLDRVERLIEELKSKNGGVRTQALELALTLFQLEKEWEMGVEAIHELLAICPATEKKHYQLMASHFYCELAAEQLYKGYVGGARDFLVKGSRIFQDNPRVNVMLAELDIRDEKYKTALKWLLQIEEQDPVYYPEIFPLLVTCYRMTDNKQLERIIRNALDDQLPDNRLLVNMADAIAANADENEALDFVISQLGKAPSIELVEKALLFLAKTGTEGQRSLHSMLQHVVKMHLESSSSYLCVNCGFEGKRHHWQCPGCNHWSTVKPVASLPRDIH